MDLNFLNGKKIRIANKTYKIKLKKKITKERHLGLTQHGENIIYLDIGQDKKSLIDTLIHEILHGIWYTQGIGNIGTGDLGTNEEYLVNSITVNLITVFQDNHWLLDLLKEA